MQPIGHQLDSHDLDNTQNTLQSSSWNWFLPLIWQTTLLLLLQLSCFSYKSFQATWQEWKKSSCCPRTATLADKGWGNGRIGKGKGTEDLKFPASAPTTWSKRRCEDATASPKGGRGVRYVWEGDGRNPFVGDQAWAQGESCRRVAWDWQEGLLMWGFGQGDCGWRAWGDWLQETRSSNVISALHLNFLLTFLSSDKHITTGGNRSLVSERFQVLNYRQYRKIAVLWKSYLLLGVIDWINGSNVARSISMQHKDLLVQETITSISWFSTNIP